MSVKESLTAVADTIRSYTGETEKLQLADMPEAIDNACNASRQKGQEEGIPIGKQAEYDRFWDLFQNYGKRSYYYYAFSWQQHDGSAWASDAYNPKYPIVCEGAYAGDSVFHYSSRMKDVKVPITARNTTMKNTFRQCYDLKNIPSLTLEGVTDFTTAFYRCDSLETLMIHGTIDANISFAESPLLSAASVQSIFDALADRTGAAALTLTFHATVGSKLTAAQKAIATAMNWTLVY